MEPHDEEKIIAQIVADVEAYGSCSIQQTAYKVLYQKISLSQQKTLAKKVVKGRRLITEIENAEVIVKQNLAFTNELPDADYDYTFIKIMAGVIIAILSFIVFKIFLPSLSH